jgi:transposase
MPSHTILPDPEKLDLIYLCAEAGRITLVARTFTPEAGCPVCGQPSHRIHSC